MLYKTQKRLFAKLRDFSSKKQYLRSVRDLDKFNKIPLYKLNKASNLYNDENGLGEFDNSQIEDYIKKRKDEKTDEVDLARRKLKYEKDLLSQKMNQIDSYENSILSTERYLNKEAAGTVAPEHPEFGRIDYNNSYSIDDTEFKVDSTSEYGNYSKYFTVQKRIEPGSRTKEKELTSMSYKKRLDFVKDKYNNKNIKHTEAILERDRRIAERLNMDIQRDDLSFTYADYLKEDSNTSNAMETLLEAKLKYNKVNYARSVEDLRKYGKVDRFLKYLNRHNKEKGRKHHIPMHEELTEGDNGSLVQRKYLGAFNYLNEMEAESFKSELETTRKRLSLEAQSDLYNLYIDGASLQELSLRYGILPKTAKRHICEHYIYWNMLYPKLGPIRHLKLMKKAENPKNVQFVDYGADLEEMAYLESVVPLRKFEYKKLDDSKVEKVADFLSKINPKRKKERYPVFFMGTFHHGYLIYNEMVRRGKAGCRPFNIFYKYLFFKDKKPGFLPDKVLKRVHLGTRLGLLGYNRSKF